MGTSTLALAEDLDTAVSTEFPRVIRRDLPQSNLQKPRVVPWLGHKIEKAVDGACSSVDHAAIGAEVREQIESRMKRERPLFIHIEQVQDLVENTLIELGYGHVALAYGKYRARRAALREIQAVNGESSEQLELASRTTNADLRARLSFAKIGLDLRLSEEELIARLLRGVSLSLTAREQRETVILNAKNLLDVDADSRFLAGRILLSYIYEETLSWKITDGIDQLKESHRKAFLQYIPYGIEMRRLDPRLAEFQLAELADAIDPYADLQFDFIGVQNLYDRYLIHVQDPSVSEGRRRIEAPQIFWMRVAMGLSILERDREQRAKEFYSIYQSKRACSSTPTLFNAGTHRPQLSSCYLLSCGDSMEEIAETWKRFSLLSKWAGGLGCAWTAVRGSGAHIHGTNGESSGVIPFLKVSNDIAVAVNQGGKRPGALCSYLELWHVDIEDFLDLRKETGDERRRTHNMNTAHWIPDLFMKRLRAISEGKLVKEATWTLLRSSDVPDLPELFGEKFEQRYLHYEELVEKGELYGKKIRVLTLWKRMIEALFETGHPWMAFKDPCNLRSPQDHAGVVHNSNLCTEITLNTSSEEVAVCNLASINIPAHLTENGSIDYPKLHSTVRSVMRMLDNVIDINYYPVEEAKAANLRHRPVGLGVMGMQDALYAKHIPFDTPAAVDLNDEILEAVAHCAYEASSDLAAERGEYPSYQGSKWDRGLLPFDTLELLEQQRGVLVLVDRKTRLDWDGLRAKIQRQGMRNSNCMAIAPTATISNIMGCTPCIEPSYKHIHTKSNLSGEFVRTNDFLVNELAKLGLWDEEMLSDLKYFDGSIQSIDRVPEEFKRLYKTAFEIEPTWLLQCAAVRQKWIDQSQSLNLFLAENDARKASFIYREAWERGLKTTYYLRTLNHSSIDSGNRDRKQKTAVGGSEPMACSIEAINNGIACESCQ